MATYLNKIKILDQNGQVSADAPFGFGIGALREEGGNIVYDEANEQGVITQKKLLAKGSKEGTYTLDGTVLQEYMDQRDTFLKKVEYNNGYINFTFQLSSEDIDDMGNLDTDSREEVISVPVNDFAIDADNIYLAFPDEESYPENIKLTESFGQYKPDSVKGYVEVPLTKKVEGETKPKSLQEMFIDAYQVPKDPVVVQPKYTVNASVIAFDTNTKEIGSKITKIKWNGTFTDGSYSYGTKENPASTEAKLSKSYKITFMDGKTSVSSTEEDKEYELNTPIQINSTEKKTYLTITGQCSYSGSRTPVNNLGGDASSGCKIADSGDNPLEATAYIQVQGYRASFYGTYSEKLISGTEQNTGSTSASIRLLTNSGETLDNGSSFSIEIPKGAVRVVIAYPSALRDLTSVKDVGDSNNEIKSGFKSFDRESNYETVKVYSENKYDSQNYKVYIMDFANPVAVANTFKVTI